MKNMANKSARHLSLAVQFACSDDALPSRAQIRRWVTASIERNAEITIRFVDANEGQAINHKYRKKNFATNVLSFVYQNKPVTGDLVLCVPVALREAREQKKPAQSHFAHMIVHGMLHLQGYDHESGEQQAARMESRECEILARFGIADPY